MSRKYRRARYAERKRQRRPLAPSPQAAPRAAAPAPRPVTPPPAPTRARSYEYVRGEVRRIGMLMGGILIILIILAVILR